MTQFVTGRASGTTDAGALEVILFVCGPRGGLRATESFTPQAARELAYKLYHAADKEQGILSREEL